LSQFRSLGSLFGYCESLAKRADKQIRTGTVFAKILTSNDDSGRHGVLVPTEAYDHFPPIFIESPQNNYTVEFHSYDALTRKPEKLAYKYYQRYPERRITRLNPCFSIRDSGSRLAVIMKAIHDDGSIGYYTDCLLSAKDGEFDDLTQLIFGSDLVVKEGLFILRSVDAPVFSQDSVLAELLDHFDRVSSMGWIRSMRSGDTGIGYTFETLIGLKENNDKSADYKGIEIKCKKTKISGTGSGKINLFQQAPVWAKKETAIERIKRIGKLEDDGHYSCYSQITTTPNNLELALKPNHEKNQIDLIKAFEFLGHWPNDVLDARLQEKHNRTIFIKADVKASTEGQQFRYKEVVYCERPSIEKFIELVQTRQLVFEFLMSEKPRAKVRNHGYPWRLVNEDILSELFSLQVKIR